MHFYSTCPDRSIFTAISTSFFFFFGFIFFNINLFIYFCCCCSTFFITFIFFNLILFFKLYIIVLVLPNIKMHPPQVYTCSPSWTPLPPSSLYHPSGSSQCTNFYRLHILDPSFLTFEIFFPRSPTIMSRCYLSWIHWDASSPGFGARRDFFPLPTSLFSI